MSSRANSTKKRSSQAPKGSRRPKRSRKIRTREVLSPLSSSSSSSSGSSRSSSTARDDHSTGQQSSGKMAQASSIRMEAATQSRGLSAPPGQAGRPRTAAAAAAAASAAAAAGAHTKAIGGIREDEAVLAERATRSPTNSLARPTATQLAPSPDLAEADAPAQPADLRQHHEAAYLRRMTAEFATDLDKLRSAPDFKNTSIAVLREALRAGADLYTNADMRTLFEN